MRQSGKSPADKSHRDDQLLQLCGLSIRYLQNTENSGVRSSMNAKPDRGFGEKERATRFPHTVRERSRKDLELQDGPEKDSSCLI